MRTGEVLVAATEVKMTSEGWNLISERPGAAGERSDNQRAGHTGYDSVEWIVSVKLHEGAKQEKRLAEDQIFAWQSEDPRVGSDP